MKNVTGMMSVRHLYRSGMLHYHVVVLPNNIFVIISKTMRFMKNVGEHYLLDITTFCAKMFCTIFT